jgi:hypothetical protein
MFMQDNFMTLFTVNIPALKVYVRDSYTSGDKTEKGLTEAYLIAVTTLASRPMLFTVHLSSGALFSRLPINAIICNRFNPDLDLSTVEEYSLEDSQAYACLDASPQYLELNYFKDYEVLCRIGEEREEVGHYLFTIDYKGSGLVDDPEQFKTHNLVALQTGQLVALPNNHVLFYDEFFAYEKTFPTNCKRQKRYVFGCA